MKHCKRILAAALAALLALSVLAGCAGGSAAIDTVEISNCFRDLMILDDNPLPTALDSTNYAQKAANALTAYRTAHPNDTRSLEDIRGELLRNAPVSDDPYGITQALVPAGSTDSYLLSFTRVEPVQSLYHQQEQSAQIAKDLYRNGPVPFHYFDAATGQLYHNPKEYAISSCIMTYGETQYAVVIVRSINAPLDS